MVTCKSCRTENVPAAVFCQKCGRRVAPTVESIDTVLLPKVSSTIRFVVSGSLAVIPLHDIDQAVIGRSDGAGTPIIDLTPHGGGQGHGVSRRHAQVTVLGSQVVILDLNSTNGTHVNGKPISTKTPVPLADGDTVDVGEVTLIFRSTE